MWQEIWRVGHFACNCRNQQQGISQGSIPTRQAGSQHRQRWMLTQYNTVLHIFLATSTIIKHSYYYIPGLPLLSGQQEIIYVNINKILPEQSIQLIICMAVFGRSFTPLDTSSANTSGLKLGHFSHFLCYGLIISATHIRMWIHVQACPFSRYSERYNTLNGF